MRGTRLRLPVKWNRIGLPILLAGGLFLLSIICFVQYHFSGRSQAEELTAALFTANSQSDLDRLTANGLPFMYEERFGSRLTEKGSAELTETGLPYALLFQEFQTLPDHSYVTDIRLEPGADESAPGTRVYRFLVTVELHLNKGPLDALSQVVEQQYNGTITLIRSGLSGWKLDGFTLG